MFFKNTYLQISRKYIIGLIFKWLVIIMSYGFIIYKIASDNSLSNFLWYIQNITYKFSGILFLVFALMFINWSIESYKWKLIVSKFEIISLKLALKAVFSGITFGIFTPNRIGELAGRVFVLKSENKAKGLSASIISSLGQSVITFTFGIISLLLIAENKLFATKLLNSNSSLILFFGLFFFTILINIVFFNFNKFSVFILRFSFFSKYKTQVDFINNYSGKDLLKVLSICLLRYMVYVSQYFLLLKFFGVEIDIFSAYISISATFMIVSIIPSIVLADFGIRGSVSLFILGVFTNSDAGIISAAFLLWLINLVIPSIIGSFLIFKTKI